MTFGSKLRALAQQRGQSQDKLAVVFDVSQTTISNWMKDEVDIPLSRAVAIAEHFGVPLDYLARQSVPEKTNDQLTREQVVANMVETLGIDRAYHRLLMADAPTEGGTDESPGAPGCRTPPPARTIPKAGHYLPPKEGRSRRSSG